MKLTKTLLAAAAVLVSTTTFAARGNPGDAYIVLDAGLSHAGNYAGLASRAAGGVTVGVKFNDFFAVETSFRDFGTRNYSVNGTANASKWNAFSISLAQGFGVGENTVLFGRIGVAETATSGFVLVGSSNSRQFRTGAQIGAGADYIFAPGFAWRTAIDVYPGFAGSKGQMTNVSTGLRYQW
jgi:hypothetical protein